jgi:hypothetical protein
MNAINLMLRAALAASVVGSLGFAGSSPASATLVTLSGLGSDFGGGSPYSESGLTSPSDTGGFVGPNGISGVVTVTPTPHGGVHAFDVTSEQFSMFNSGDAAQNVTMGDATPVTETLPDYGTDNNNFTATTALARPEAGAIMLMLMGFVGLGLAARRLLRKAQALFAT